MRGLRFIIFLPVATLALFDSTVVAQDFQTWTCWQSSELSWQMQQPIADYEAGLYPTWADCEAWRDGSPAEGWQWSYGASVATTTTDATTTTLETTTTTSTVAATTTSTDPVPTSEESPTTTSPPTTSTTEPATTTTETTSTTSPPPPTPEPTPETTSPETTAPQTTVAPSTTATPTTSRPPVSSTTSRPPSATTVPAQPEDRPVSIVVDVTESVEPDLVEADELRDTPLDVESLIEDETALRADPVRAIATLDLGELTATQLEDVFAVVFDEPLTNEEVAALVLIVNEAPEEVKQALEAAVNVFGEGFDQYVPSGSSITVAQRRVVVAAGALLSALPTAPVAGGSSRRRRV